MIDTVAVLSDIHGVLPALAAVLAEPDVRAADRVVVTGDIASGPQPVAAIDALAALGDRLLLVRGNADRELAALARGSPIDAPDDISRWAAAQLRPDQVDLLSSLPPSREFDLNGFGHTLFCHATPRSDQEIILVDSAHARWAEVLQDLPPGCRTIVCGHTHMPFARLVDRRLIVNPGSIGMPYGRPGASWALLQNGQVSLRHTAIDIDTTIEVIAAASGYPGAREWADYFVRATASDTVALTTFAARAAPEDR